MEGLHHASLVTGPGIGACGLPATGAGIRHHVFICATVKVLLHMGDDHVPFGYQDAASGVQFKVFDEGQVMEACPGDLTAVNLHCVKNSNRCDFAAASGLPFNGAEDCFINIILKLEGNAIIIIARCPAETCGIGKAVIPQHHPVDGNVRSLRKVLQVPDLLFNFFCGGACRNRHKRTDSKTEINHGKQQCAAAVPYILKFVHACKDIESKKADFPFPAGVCIQASDRAGGKVPGIAVGFPIASCKSTLQTFKVALMDETFA